MPSIAKSLNPKSLNPWVYTAIMAPCISGCQNRTLIWGTSHVVSRPSASFLARFLFGCLLRGFFLRFGFSGRRLILNLTAFALGLFWGLCWSFYGRFCYSSPRRASMQVYIRLTRPFGARQLKLAELRRAWNVPQKPKFLITRSPQKGPQFLGTTTSRHL